MTDDTKKSPFRVINGDGQPTAPETPTAPMYEYLIIDTNYNDHYAEGFLVFTTQHVAVMRDEGAQGALPVLLMPLTSVFKVVLLEDDEVEADTTPF